MFKSVTIFLRKLKTFTQLCQHVEFCFAFSYRLWTNISDKEFDVLEATLSPNVSETENQVNMSIVRYYLIGINSRLESVLVTLLSIKQR